MTLVEPAPLDHTLPAVLLEALAFEAPYVIERLVNDRIVDPAARAEQLFTEVKKYLVMSHVNRDVVVGMCSARVDEAWHAFILYTDEYANYCKKYFGRYVGHAPKNAPAGAPECQEPRVELSFNEFCETYEELFHELLPDVWYDPRNIVPTQRVFNDSAGHMHVVRHGTLIELADDDGGPLLSVNAIAYDALVFIARTGAFYVRELPGDLSDAEKVRLVEALLTVRALRLAP